MDLSSPSSSLTYFGEDESEFVDVKMTISQVKCGARIKDDPFNDMGWDEDCLFDE